MQYKTPPRSELLVLDTAHHHRHLGWGLSAAAPPLCTILYVLQGMIYCSQCSVMHTFRSFFSFLSSSLQRNKVHIKIIDQCHHMPTIKKKNTIVWKFTLRFPQQLFHSPTCNINHSILKYFKGLQKRKE